MAENKTLEHLPEVRAAVAALSPEDQEVLAAVQTSPFKLTAPEQFKEFAANIDYFVFEPNIHDLNDLGWRYLDGDLDADSYIYIDSSGGLWGLYERAPGAETTEVDGGFISAPTDVDDVYYAVSTTYQDVTYEFTLFDTDSIVWGGENDYYERLE